MPPGRRTTASCCARCDSAPGVGTHIGGSASGVLAEGREFEGTPGISALALWLPDMTATPVRLHQESLPLLDEPETWHAHIGVDPGGQGCHPSRRSLPGGLA